MLKLYNSFSNAKENFKPFDDKIVKIFICGPTLYDHTHLGHARIFLTYDLLCKVLQRQGFLTDVLVNMTDINQNVFNKATENSVNCDKIATFYAGQFMNDLNTLHINTIDRLVFVSDYVSAIEKYVGVFLKQNLAYTANGNVYLDTLQVHDYGKVSKQTRDELNLHRLDIGPNKKNQEDVMLWNCSDDFGISWESKFGRGVPWWHIQDTAVALENFGQNYDIHGGARELLYPHHEAHLAQYKLLTKSDTPVKIWMYVGLVLSEKEKMSKSLGNVVWIKDLVEKYGSNLIRLYLLSFSYDKDVNFVENELLSKKPLLDMLYETKLKTTDITDKDAKTLINNFVNALNDNLNSPLALEILYTICVNVKKGQKISKNDFLLLCEMLGMVL